MEKKEWIEKQISLTQSFITAVWLSSIEIMCYFCDSFSNYLTDDVMKMIMMPNGQQSFSGLQFFSHDRRRKWNFNIRLKQEYSKKLMLAAVLSLLMDWQTVAVMSSYHFVFMHWYQDWKSGIGASLNWSISFSCQCKFLLVLWHIQCVLTWLQRGLHNMDEN